MLRNVLIVYGMMVCFIRNLFHTDSSFNKTGISKFLFHDGVLPHVNWLFLYRWYSCINATVTVGSDYSQVYMYFLFLVVQDREACYPRHYSMFLLMICCKSCIR